MAEEFTHQVDDFYFSALFDADELFPISDDKYANELALQEVLISSAIATTVTTTTTTAATSCRRMSPKKDLGQSSNSVSDQPFCKICMEAVPPADMFANPNCSHAFCRNCLGQHIGTRVRENISAVECPDTGCKGLLEPEFCRDIIPRQVFERWGNALCESMILASKRFVYCPFKDCSALLIDDGDGEEVRQSTECPSCKRLFCAKCAVAWHSGLSCEEVQRLRVDERGREDLMLLEVVKEKRWKRCPKCKFYVEKTQGCLHVTCRCGFEFCYGCGSKWGVTHASCSINLQ